MLMEFQTHYLSPDIKVSSYEDKFFKTCIFLLLFFDGAATYDYLHILPAWYQWLFTFLVPICIGFFGKKGLTLVIGAIYDYIQAGKKNTGVSL